MNGFDFFHSILFGLIWKFHEFLPPRTFKSKAIILKSYIHSWTKVTNRLCNNSRMNHGVYINKQYLILKDMDLEEKTVLHFPGRATLCHLPASTLSQWGIVFFYESKWFWSFQTLVGSFLSIFHRFTYLTSLSGLLYNNLILVALLTLTI